MVTFIQAEGILRRLGVYETLSHLVQVYDKICFQFLIGFQPFVELNLASLVALINISMSPRVGL